MNTGMIATITRPKVLWEPYGNFRYKAVPTGASSEKYGPCEVCFKEALEVFMQIEEVWCNDRHRYVRYRCLSLIGHLSCLTLQRREREAVQ